MLVLYCLDPLEPCCPEEVYADEAASADRLSIPWALVDHDAIVQGNFDRALRRVPVQSPPATGVYRGWMMSVAQYTQLFQALATRGIRLVNDPDAYRHCHHLPESYPILEGHTPKTVWLPSEGNISIDQVMELLRPFGDAPIVLKDYVKSQKHAWNEACFIPSASDRAAVERVVGRFLELQGADLVGGLVFREFVSFESIGRHSHSGLPLTREYRLFFLDGRLILGAEYWEEGTYNDEKPPVEGFTTLASKVRSRFFSMDVAKQQDGGWLVVELGDGQVTGLPERADVETFYHGLATLLG